MTENTHQDWQNAALPILLEWANDGVAIPTISVRLHQLLTRQGLNLAVADVERFILAQEKPILQHLNTKACEQQKGHYLHPFTGYMVFTSHFHLQRGQCCQNRCMHCPYGFN